MADKGIRILDMIAADMKSDVEELEGKSFNGRVVAENFGKQAAAIVALTKVIKAMLE